MLLAFTADNAEFPPLSAADNEFWEPNRARLGFDTGDVVAGLGIGFIIGLGDKCGGLTLSKDVGDFKVFCSFSFVKSPLLDGAPESFETVGLKGRLDELEDGEETADLT